MLFTVFVIFAGHCSSVWNSLSGWKGGGQWCTLEDTATSGQTCLGWYSPISPFKCGCPAPQPKQNCVVSSGGMFSAALSFAMYCVGSNCEAEPLVNRSLGSWTGPQGPG